MAEPTLDEKVAAAKAALAGHDVQDDDEAERAAVIFSALEALRQNPPIDPEIIRKIVKEEIAALVPPEPAEPPAMVTALLNSDDPAMKTRIKVLNDETLAILKEIMTTPTPE